MSYKNIFVFSFANGRDVVADASHLMTAGEGTLKVGDLELPETFLLTKPRLIMMHNTPTGIQVGMAPVNIDDASEAKPIPFMRSALAYAYALPEKSKLAANYMQSVSTIDLATSLAGAAPKSSNSPYRAG